jgi:hypothetical protein
MVVRCWVSLAAPCLFLGLVTQEACGGHSGQAQPFGAAGQSPAAADGGGGSAGTDEHSAHGHALAGAAGIVAANGGSPSPNIDTSTLPKGDPGSATMDIRATSEQPETASDGVGAFRTNCDFSHMLWDDPIVYPGKPGLSHLHTFFGNGAVDAYSTPDSILHSGTSTCRGGIANRSSYWVPALLDASGTPIVPTGISVYYKSGYLGIKPSQIQDFPTGLRVIAGSASASATQPHSYWACLNHYIGHFGTFAQCQSDDTLMMVIDFPQCWDGVHLDSSDHTSHMSYPVSGSCPSTHPVAIPMVTFNVYYEMRDTTGWRLASDAYETSKPGGYSTHGDWFEGWDNDVAKTFVQDCVRAGLDCHSHLLGDGRMIF